MNRTKTRQRFRLSRLCSLEGLLGLFGLFSLAAGLWQSQPLQIFWGATILLGLWVLGRMRRRDWDRHWQALGAPRRSKDDQRP